MRCSLSCDACPPRASPEMQLERLTSADASRLGGPAGLASHLRSLVPAADSVREVVRDIVEAGRTRGGRARLGYTRRFDTAGSGARAVTAPGAEPGEAPQPPPPAGGAGPQVAA